MSANPVAPVFGFVVASIAMLAPSYIVYRHLNESRRAAIAAMEAERSSLAANLATARKSLASSQHRIASLSREAKTAAAYLRDANSELAAASRVHRDVVQGKDREIRKIRTQMEAAAKAAGIKATEEVKKVAMENAELWLIVYDVSKAMKLTPGDVFRLEREERKKRARGLGPGKRREMIDRINKRRKESTENTKKMWDDAMKRMVPRGP